MKSYPIKCHLSNTADVTRVDVYDDIGAGGFFSDGISAADFAASLTPVRGALEVHINSGGGNVFDGVAIAEAIRSHKGRVTTYVDGVAASIASVIAQAGQERVMAPGSMLMIHDASGFCDGNSADMAKTAEILSKVSDNIAEQYAKRAGGTKDDWRAAMLAESWYTADEAVDAGLADRIGAEGSAMWPASLDVAAFTSVPGRIAASIRQMSAAQAAPIHDAMTGTHTHPDPAYGDELAHKHTHDGDAVHDRSQIDPDGDGDDDTTAAGDTDHDYVKPDGSPGPKARASFPLLAADLDNSAWDASKAWHNGAESDDPAVFYRGICAGRRAGDPATQDAWALPYKYTPSSPPNTAGVRAALSRLPQTDDLTNATEARATLEKVMKQINPDYDPDDYIDPELLSAVFALGLEGAHR